MKWCYATKPNFEWDIGELHVTPCSWESWLIGIAIRS